MTVLNDSPQCSQWTQAAAGFAKQWDASLTGIHVEPEVVDRNYITADISKMLSSTQQVLEDERSAKIRSRFNKTVKTFELDVNWRSCFGDAETVIRRAARFFDVVFVGVTRNASERIYGEQGIVENIAIGSGRPVVLIPEGYSDQFDPKRVVLAWDGSREAVRAITDSLPLMKRADEVSILTIVKKDDRRPTSKHTPKELALYLSEQGIRTESIAIKAKGSYSGQLLLEQASKLRADLVVLGAYGHSRFREMVLGGVTRHVLAHSKIPLLMSH